MDPNRDDLLQLASTVWSSVLSLPTIEVDPRPPHPGTYVLIGTIRFDGAWVGHLDLRCSAAAAREVAGAMFATDPADLAEDEIRDALGELANIVGGNLKALLPQPTHISLPIVRTTEWRAEANNYDHVVGLASGDGPFALGINGVRG